MEFKVLDYGKVKLVDHMGTDKAIVDAARVSYDPGSTKHTSSDEGLIRYLYRHKHTTPFEMCEVKLYLKMPIYVARQWIRHRTANINEYSGRYSVMKEEFHRPEELRHQSKTNKQGSEEGEPFDDFLLGDWNMQAEEAFETYSHLVKAGAAREQARIHLPLSTYTEFYWKVDLHNLLHFLKLRTDPHAQLEIRLFADTIEAIVASLYPIAYRAWYDYSKKAYNMSRMEVSVFKELIHSDPDNIEAFKERVKDRDDLNDREKADFINAFLVD